MSSNPTVPAFLVASNAQHDRFIDLEQGLEQLPRSPTPDSFSTCETLEKPAPVALAPAAWQLQHTDSHNVSHSTHSLDSLHLPSAKDEYPLTPKRGTRTSRFARWTLFSLYRRLFCFAFLANLIIFIVLLSLPGERQGFTAQNLATATSANLMAAIVFRNEHVINLLFAIFTSIPLSAPLCIRRTAAKVYEHGGLHSGCAVAAVCWYVGFTIIMTHDFIIGVPMVREDPAVLAITYTILALLLTIVTFAHPKLRAMYHDYFEAVHRFAGWTTVALFWAFTILVARSSAHASHRVLGQQLIRTPDFWFLIVITTFLIYPWARLRRATVVQEHLSDHVTRLHFSYANMQPFVTLRLSTSPLTEWHSFATVPSGPPNADSAAAKNFSLVVSNAGDWTRRIIRSDSRPTSFWIRGAPTQGVLCSARLFHRIVLVTTGSGIGPCLSLLIGAPELASRCRVLWSTPSPISTYGKGIVDTVLRSDPEAVIIDTRAPGGRPDMVALTWRLVRESGAEAVFCISNPKVTRKVVYAMETRGIPAFGPIFDS